MLAGGTTGTERNRTSNKLTQKRHCVYNINLQNITLQKPIVAKTPILDVSSVSQIRSGFIYTLNLNAQQYFK